MPTEYKIASTPIGSLEWVTVRGEPADYENDKKFKWKADLVLTEGEAKDLLAKQAKLILNNTDYDPEVDNRPTLCIVPYVKTEKNAEGKKSKVKVAGKYKLKARTNAEHYKTGERTVLPLYSASGAPLELEVNDIGNGSTGRLQGMMKYYKPNGKSWGVAFYLNGLQLKDKVTRVEGGGEGFEPIEGCEGMAPVDTPELG